MTWTVLQTPDILQVMMVWTFCFLVGFLCGRL